MSNLTVSAIQAKIIRLPQRPPFMLTRDLAEIYESDPRQLAQAVRRNPDRFPEDFCFELSAEEVGRLQNEATPHLVGQKRALAFTRLGANMLSAVLKSKVAAARCVQIMRAFSALEEAVPAGAPEPNTLSRETLREVLRAAVDRLSENDWLEAGFKAPPEVADETFYLKQKVVMWSVEARKSWDENRRLEELLALYRFKAEALAAKLQPEPKRKAYSPAEEAEVWRRHLANEGPSAIAKALGRSVNSIENLIRRLRRQGGPK
jgi:hypothetical protein